MAKIVEYVDIPLDQLRIGKGQVRTRQVGEEIDELAKSIKTVGLLQPIVVCATEDGKNWEILTGQRRFLAHKKLGKETITAAVLDERVDEDEAKIISVTENLIRRNLSPKELIDAITFLYNKYGTIKAVVEHTGLSQRKVSDYVKFPRLLPKLKEMVKDGQTDVNTALKAQDASVGEDGEANLDDAIILVEEMNSMTDFQKKKVGKERKKDPSMPVDEAVENAKSGENVTQINVTITRNTNTALQKYANNGNIDSGEAAAELIEDALVKQGFLEDG